MEYIRKFSLYFYHATDINYFIESESKNHYYELISSNHLFDYLTSGAIEEANKNGSGFLCVNEKDLIIKNEENAVNSFEGKGIFTPSFFEEYVPLLITENNPEVPLNDKANILPGHNTRDILGVPNEFAIYQGAQIRLFPNGSLSIRFSFTNPNHIQDFYGANVDNFIKILKILEEQTILGFSNRLTKIMHYLATTSNLVSDYTKLRFKENGHNGIGIIDSNFRSYRTIIIDGLNEIKKPGPENRSIWKLQTPNELDNKTIFGIMNNAAWYKDYKDGYIDKKIEKDLGYKENEKYLCDDYTSLFVLPEYWTTKRVPNFVTRLILLSELLNAQICGLENISNSLEKLIYRNQKDFKKLISKTLMMNGLILQMEKMGDVSSSVSHGFTRKYITSVSNELGVGIHLQRVNQRMKVLAERISLQSNQKIVSNSIALNRKGFVVALTLFIITIVFSVIEIHLMNSQYKISELTLLFQILSMIK